MICPLIWLCTVTVASGVTAPRPIRVIGMSPDCARAATTGIGPPPAKRPAGGRVALGVRSHASSAIATRTPAMISTRRERSRLRHSGRASVSARPAGLGAE